MHYFHMKYLLPIIAMFILVGCGGGNTHVYGSVGYGFGNYYYDRPGYGCCIDRPGRPDRPVRPPVARPPIARPPIARPTPRR